MKERDPERDFPSFGEWLRNSEVLGDGLPPARRIGRLLAEIQKRTLADQVMVFARSSASFEWELFASSPEAEAPVLPQELLSEVLAKLAVQNRTLSLQDMKDNPGLEQRFRALRCRTLLVQPLSGDDGPSDALVVVNPSELGDPARLLDLAVYSGALLSLALHNHRLFSDLQQKDVELNSWAEHIERRIEEGTKKLLERELQYHSLFEGTNDGIVVHDRDGAVLEVNKVSCRLFGYERKEFLARTWADLFGGRPNDDAARFFSKTLKNEVLAPLDATLFRRDASTFSAEVSSRKVRFLGKEAIQSVIRDVTVRKTLEAGLREEREKYRLLVESSLVGVFIIEDGTVRFANAKFAEILGTGVQALVGKPYFDLIDPEDRSMVQAREGRRLQNGEPQERYELRYLRLDGSRCWCEIHGCRIELEGRPSVLGNALDISQRKQWETQLLEAQKMESIGTLAGGIAHDFNNLLGGILGYASLLLSELKEDHPFYQDLLAIAETAKKAADLTNRLLAFARGGKYQVSTLQVNKIAEDVLGILSHSVDPSIAVETHFHPQPWPVRGDSRQIHQTFMNVCLNAVDAMQGGGRLLLTTDNLDADEAFVQNHIGMKPGAYVRIDIADTGFGMDARTQSRMFEPFFTTKPANEAKGLGLSMVYGIVKNHGGIIHVVSERGKGTVLTIFLPRASETQDEPAGRKAEKAGGNKILLVDDEEIIRHVGDRMLRKKGFEVILARNGREAVDLFTRDRHQIAVVLMDLIMPEMDGKEAYQKLKEIDPAVKVVFTSGYGPHDRPDLLHPGVLFLQKPFHTEILYATIQKAIQNGSRAST